MFRFIFFTSLLLITFSAHAAPKFDPARNAEMQMKGVDINKNGSAELKEYLRIAELLFVRMDVNGDHEVSPKELANYRFRNIPKVSEERKMQMGISMVNSLDKNHDHLLNKDEYQQPARDDFNRTDINHDMKITRAEMTANWKRKMAELKAKLEEE